MTNKIGGGLIANLRDLGGYKGKNGRKVRSELIYRSGTFDQPIEVLADILNPLEISVIFDLRLKEEAEFHPYTLPKSIAYKHRPIITSLQNLVEILNVSCPETKNDSMNMCLRAFTFDYVEFWTGFMQVIYRLQADSPTRYGEIIKEMIEIGGKPLIFHCSAGKDRTGVLAAMILLALGVSSEDVMQDYLLSNEYRKEAMVRRLEEIPPDMNNPKFTNQFVDMLLVKEAYLQATFDALNAYPTFDLYAEYELGLSRDDLETFRELYLE